MSLVSALICNFVSFGSKLITENAYHLTMIIIALILNLVACSGVSFLLGFHVYLWHIGMSSLEYLRMVEEKEKQ